ncbi:glycosyltransferase family 4 protein [Acetobacterium bakii]|uniref:Glycosyl transferase family 1 n=1 Tax=Acetobacterium bakii TaxID=52689 RepID=A0A0L6U2F3_9FIRM|nr:glycosyltransferase family 4 protein [Acetobacterium bakii]KNZ42522.1 hypothetical protein AKG39_06270 [Acetobacterium bakii]
MKKALVFASVASMIDQFNMDNIQIIKGLGYQVEVACNFKFGSTTTNERVENFKKELSEKNIKYYHIPVPRGVKNLRGIYEAYKELKYLIEKNDYSLVHCHSPIGGVIARIACKQKRNEGLKVIYTAHGFQFFKGSRKRYWLFYPIEKYLSKYTDVLITINKEDYNLAVKKMHALETKYIPGVGVDTKKFIDCKVDRLIKRAELSVPDVAIMVLSVGELVKRKNHEIIIKALAKMEFKNVYYFVCGKGQLDYKLKELTKSLDLENRVSFLGYRQEIPELCKLADIYAFPSTREGLGLAGIEGMAAGLPIVTSNLNGIKDYSVNGKTGYVCEPRDVDSFANALDKLCVNKKLRNDMGKYNAEACKKFDIYRVNKTMTKIYKEFD